MSGIHLPSLCLYLCLSLCISLLPLSVSAGSVTETTDRHHQIISPAFIGFLSQRLDFAGKNNSIYNLLNDEDTLINGRFRHVERNNCPPFAYQCFLEPGSYISEISILTSAGDQVHIEAGSRDAAKTPAFKRLTLNKRSVFSGVQMNSSSVSLKQVSDDTVNIVVGLYQIMLHVDDEEGFIHIDSIKVLDWSHMITVSQPHGLIGQTWKRLLHMRDPANLNGVEGTAEDYEIRDSKNIFSTSFKYNKFTSKSNGKMPYQNKKQRGQQQTYKKQ